MVRPGLRRALLQSRRGARSCPPCDRLIDGRVCGSLHSEHALIFRIPTWVWTITVAVFAITQAFQLGLLSIRSSPKRSPVNGRFDRVQLERPTQTPNEGQAWAVALQLPKGAGPVPAELRTPQALSRLRRRTPQRPDRGGEREAGTPFAGLRWSWQNFAAAMIEAPRRHGHFDPRWHTDRLSPCDHEESDRAPMIRTAGDAGARVSDDVGRFPRQRHALVPAVAGDNGPSIHRWENEGGSYSTTDELDLKVNGCEKPPAGLEWYAFLSRYFAGRRRHDLEALKAYEAYRSGAVAPSISHRSHTAPRGDPPQGDVTRSRARPRARSSVVPRVRVGNSFTVAGRVSIATVS